MRFVNSSPESGVMLKVGFSAALPSRFRLRKLPPRCVSWPPTLSVVVQSKVAAMLEVEVK